VVVGLGLLLVYSSNDRDLGTHDTVGTTLLPYCLIRGQGISLNRFWIILRQRDGFAPFVVPKDGRILSRYPIAPALVILPLAAAQVALLDWRHPGWDSHPGQALLECKWMAKRSMGVLMALAGAIFHRYLLRVGLRRTAVPAVLAAFLGSDLWTHASQALWQHGPAALALIVAIALLDPGPVSRLRLVLAGAATVGLVAVRLIDLILAAMILAWVARTERARLAWFVSLPVLGAAALLGYNLWFFGTITGGQAELEALHPKLHRVAGMWGSLAEGAAGTLFSPNRGLLVFSPWIAVALGMLLVPAVARRLGARSLVCWLLVGLVPYFLLLSKYAVWWGGHCFGARYWTDVIPLFAIVFAFGLEWMLDHSRILAGLAALCVAVAIGIHAIGAFCYPSTWNHLPANVDLNHERLWDWRDTELSRCLIERAAGH
jgi:hypothetical protein